MVIRGGTRGNGKQLAEYLLAIGENESVRVFDIRGTSQLDNVYERYDHDTGKMISDSFSRLAQDRARKTMEKELDHKQTPERNPRRPEMKIFLTNLWHQTSTAEEFITEAKKNNYQIARGEERRPLMVVDEKGRSFDLVRQLDKVKSREARERFKGQNLMTEKQAIQSMRVLKNEKALNEVQEKLIDKIDVQNESQHVKTEQRKFFDLKRNEIKESGARITTDFTDENISFSQEKNIEKLNAFKEKEHVRFPQLPTETDRDRRRRAFLAQLNDVQNTNHRTKQKGLEI